MRKDPTEFRKRFQSWKLGIPAYRAGKPIGEDEDTRSDTTREGYNEREVPYGAGNGPAGDSPLKILDILNEKTAAVPKRAGLVMGEPPAVGIRNPGMFNTSYLLKLFGSPSKAVGRQPMFMTDAVRKNTANLKSALMRYEGNAPSKLTKQGKAWVDYNKNNVDLSLFTATDINKLVKMNRKDLNLRPDQFVKVTKGGPGFADYTFDVMKNGSSIADMEVGLRNGVAVPEMVSSFTKQPGMSRTLYDAAILSGEQLGYNGLLSGELLISAPKTWSVWKHYPTKKLMKLNGVHQNRMMTKNPNKDGKLLKNLEEAKKAAEEGRSFTIENGPVYLLDKESQFVPVKSADVFDASILDANGVFNRNMNSANIYKAMLPFAIGGGLWGSKEHKNGKDLPRFAGGRDGARYVPTDDGWGRITDSDVANLMENWVVTPFGVRNKFDYEYNPNYKQPIGKNAAVRQDNNTWTRQRVAEESNKRSWLSDAADVSHAIGEGAMLASTFAAPEVEPLVYPAYLATKNAVLSALTSNTPVMLYVRYPLGKVMYGMDALFPTLYRKIKSMPTEPVNGTIQISNPGNRFVFSNTKKESPIITNFTYDAPVRKHASGNWDPGFTLAMPGRKTLLGKNVISTEPSDLFTYGDDIKIPLSDVTLISGDLDEIALANQYGYKVATSPKLLQLYLEGDSPGVSFMSKRGQKINLRKQDLSAYAKEVENMTRLLFKSPTKNDVDFMNFVLLPKIKGDVYDPSMLDYLINNGIGPFGDRIGNAELRSYLLDPDRWRNILYDPATHAESQFRDLMGIELRSKFKSGKDIYIKPSHRGRFTALKKRTGHSASWFKAHGTPALKKMATFALNAKKWKH